MGSTESKATDGIAQRLAGERLLITGATGFIGKMLIEKLLWAVPEAGRLSLLIRPSGGRSAGERLREEVLAAPIMAQLRARHGEGWEEWAMSRVEAVAGDLAAERLGLDAAAYDELAGRVDRVLASGATVTFDERLDRALDVNVHGALAVLELARRAGAPLLHVSTCFVSGKREGVIFESIGSGDALGDPDAVLASLAARRAELERAGAPGDDAAWIAAGAAEAERHGFHDVYTLTKALAERLLERRRGGVPLAVLRPAIVESAADEPIAGWIEGVRVADPMLVAYGRGRASELPGSPDARLELVPVDFVTNATLAALAALPRGARADEAPVAVYQLSSSRHPITLGELFAHARRGFERAPLTDDEGEPIAVGAMRFLPPDRYLERLEGERRKVQRLLRWLPLGRDSKRRRELGASARLLDHLIHLLAVYRPYLEHGARYDDAATRELWEGLSAADREAFPFDVAALDWSAYVAETHVPGLVRFALRAESGAPVPVAEDRRESAETILERASRHAAEARTLYELFAATAAAYPEGVAFQTHRDGRWLRYTYAQAEIAVANLAWRLAERHGVAHGDKVVLWASGRPEWVIATLAAHRLGAATVPLDPQWPAEEVADAARLVGAKLVCAAPPLVAGLAALPAERGPGCELATLAAPFVPEPDAGPLPEAEGLEPAGDEDDVASILFTSGTTVAPKAVPLTHANYLSNTRDLIPLMRLTRERLLSVLPIHHVFEQQVGLLVPLAGGGAISYVAELKPDEISWMMRVTRPTVLVAVPRLLALLDGGIRRSVEAGGAKLALIFRVLFALSRRKDGATGHRLFSKVHQRFGGSLRRIASGGSALDPDLGRRFQLMGFRVAEGYGMTETSPVLTVNPWDAIRFGSVGRPLPSVEIELREPAEAVADLEPGAGEVWVRGPNVMAGYYRNPEATAAAMDGEWLNTGDLGAFDDEGYLRLSGRTKDVIVTAAGKNVYPEEVEARYRDLPGVEELVILGLPADGGGGERVTALVVPAPGADEGAIRAAVAERSKSVPSYQQVAGVELWRGELPKTTTMKVKRAQLRAAVLAGERGAAPASSKPGRKPPAEPPAAQPMSAAEREALEALARLVRTRPDLLSRDDRLAELGVDSLTRVELVGELEVRFDRRLTDTEAAALDRVDDLLALARGAR